MKIGILLVSFAAAGVFARPDETRRFYFSSPWKMDFSRESRLPIEQSEITDFAATLALPAFAFVQAAPRGTLSVRYRPEYEAFSRHWGLNAWHHTASLSFTYRATPRMTVDAADVFVRTTDPTKNLPGIFPLLPRGRFWENTSSLAVSYDFSRRTLLKFGFDNAASAFSAFGGSPQAQFSQFANALTGEVSRALGDRHQIIGSYTLLNFRDLNGGGGTQTTTSDFLAVPKSAL